MLIINIIIFLLGFTFLIIPGILMLRENAERKKKIKEDTEKLKQYQADALTQKQIMKDVLAKAAALR